MPVFTPKYVGIVRWRFSMLSPSVVWFSGTNPPPDFLVFIRMIAASF